MNTKWVMHNSFAMFKPKYLIPWWDSNPSHLFFRMMQCARRQGISNPWYVHYFRPLLWLPFSEQDLHTYGGSFLYHLNDPNHLVAGKPGLMVLPSSEIFLQLSTLYWDLFANIGLIFAVRPIASGTLLPQLVWQQKSTLQNNASIAIIIHTWQNEAFVCLHTPVRRSFSVPKTSGTKCMRYFCFT
jgi:hypothetical protein